ncbi:MAG: hypothetical protein ASARMPRED_001989 [Alectoria sarmentosa]|nr:MAG: hypothetical protein ASARMPRED_001989 [Alectoria sarmentosa]
MPEDNTTHHGRLHSFPLKPRLKIYDFALVRPNKIVRQGEYKAGKPRSHAKGQKHLTDHRSTVQAFLLSTPDIFSELPALLIGTNDSSPSSPSERTSSEDHDDADTEYREFAVHKVPCIAKKSCRRSCARTVLRVTLAKVSELAHELGIRGSAPNDISATVNSIRRDHIFITHYHSQEGGFNTSTRPFAKITHICNFVAEQSSPLKSSRQLVKAEPAKKTQSYRTILKHWQSSCWWMPGTKKSYAFVKQDDGLCLGMRRGLEFAFLFPEFRDDSSTSWVECTIATKKHIDACRERVNESKG